MRKMCHHWTCATNKYNKNGSYSFRRKQQKKTEKTWTEPKTEHSWIVSTAWDQFSTYLKRKEIILNDK